MQTLPEIVETYRSNCAIETFPAEEGPLYHARLRWLNDLYDRIFNTPLVNLEDGPAKISAIFMNCFGQVSPQEAAAIIRIAEDMGRLAGEAQP